MADAALVVRSPATSPWPSPCLHTAARMAQVWLKRNGIVWDGVRLRRGGVHSQRGLGLVAARDASCGEALVRIPKAAVLSTLNSACARALDSLARLGVPQSALLNLAVAHEVQLGPRSRWCVPES